MNISRGEVNEFHFSSASIAGVQAILTIGTANNDPRKIRITDLKMTCATSAEVRLVVSSYGTYGKTLFFNLPANSSHDFHWEIPYKYDVVASTVETRRFLASTEGTGVQYSISGYMEK